MFDRHPCGGSNFEFPRFLMFKVFFEIFPNLISDKILNIPDLFYYWARVSDFEARETLLVQQVMSGNNVSNSGFCAGLKTLK